MSIFGHLDFYSFLQNAPKSLNPGHLDSQDRLPEGWTKREWARCSTLWRTASEVRDELRQVEGSKVCCKLNDPLLYATLYALLSSAGVFFSAFLETLLYHVTITWVITRWWISWKICESTLISSLVSCLNYEYISWLLMHVLANKSTT